MKSILNTVTFIQCPGCSDPSAFRIPSNFELGKSFGEWHCDRCGTGIHGIWRGKDTEIEVSGEPWSKLLCLVLIPEPTMLTIETLYPSDDLAMIRYSVEIGSCPANTLNDRVHSVICSDLGPSRQGLPLNSDPHGLLRLVAAIPFRPEWSIDTDTLCNLDADELDGLFQGQLAENLL